MGNLWQPARPGRAVLSVLFIAILCTTFAGQTQHFDGIWWLARTAAEQEGFILGFGDCWADPDVQRVRVLTTDETLRVAVSDYYQGHAAQRGRLVPDVLKEIWSGHLKVPGSEKSQPGQGWRDRHGFFDGSWWKGSNTTERLGFVEGYTTCVNSGKNKSATLKLAPAQYVQWVDRWYSAGEDNETAAQRQAVKIAAVLLRVGNHPTSGAQ